MLTGVDPVPYVHPVNQFRYVPIRRRQIRGADAESDIDRTTPKKDTAEAETANAESLVQHKTVQQKIGEQKALYEKRHALDERSEGLRKKRMA